MGKLHELLAVEGNLSGEAQRVVSQVKSLFTDGTGRLKGETRTYKPLYEDGDQFLDEITELATTVAAELLHVRETYGRWVDAAVQKETTNRETTASVEVDGEVVFGDLPAPALLNLESKLAELRHVYAAIPTNDPTEAWVWSGQEECYISRERQTFRTKKLPKPLVKYEATPEHPAQTEVYAEDIRVGAWTTVIRSGMVSPSIKRQLLAQLDVLARAVKEARQRANNTEVMDVHVAEKIFDFIHKGT